MSVETLIPVDEYLNTSYDPDVECVDGVLVECNVGDWLHGLVQSSLIFALRLKYPEVFVIPELRSKTRETGFRLPDVCVLLYPPKTKYLLDASFMAIETLSEDDRMTRIMEKLEEYEQKGVPNIWVIDPRLKMMPAYSHRALQETRADVIATDEARLELTRQEIFTQVDAE